MKKIVLIALSLLCVAGCKKESAIVGKYSRTETGIVEVIELGSGGTYNFYNTDSAGNIDGRVQTGKYSSSNGSIEFDGQLSFTSGYYSNSSGQIARWHNYTPISGEVSGSILKVKAKDEKASRWGLFSETKYEDNGTTTLTFVKK